MPRPPVPSRPGPRTRLALAVVLLAPPVSLGLYFGLGVGNRYPILGEDRLVETATVAAFAAAAVLGWIRRRTRPLARGIAAIGILGALEEVGFGERLLGWTPPQVGGVPIDGLHDFLFVGREALGAAATARPLAATVAGAGLLGALALFAGLARAHLGRLARVVARDLGRDEARRLVALTVLCGGVAVVLDLDLLDFLSLVAVEESLELAGAVSLVLAALSCRPGPLPDPPETRSRAAGRRTAPSPSSVRPVSGSGLGRPSARR